MRLRVSVASHQFGSTVVKPTAFYLPCVLTISCDFAIYSILFSLVKNKNKIFPLAVAGVLNVSVNQTEHLRAAARMPSAK